MSERNEDKHGIIIDKDHQFNSLEEAGNYIKDLKDKLKRKAGMEEFPITYAMPEDRLNYLRYGISLLTQKNLPFTKLCKIQCAQCVLWGLAQGYTYGALSQFLMSKGQKDATIEKVKEVEQEGLKLVAQAIERVKNLKVPILGGV